MSLKSLCCEDEREIAFTNRYSQTSFNLVVNTRRINNYDPNHANFADAHPLPVGDS